MILDDAHRLVEDRPNLKERDIFSLSTFKVTLLGNEVSFEKKISPEKEKTLLID